MKDTSKLKFKLLFLFVCLLLIVLRAPELLLHPRLWAEEGSVFYAFAYTNGTGELFLHPQLGYYSLYNNLITLIGIQLPLEYFPYLTTCTGLMLQLTVIWLILSSDSVIWDSRFKKILVCLFLILVTPAAAWLNSTGAHLHLSIISLIILFKNKPTSLYEKIFIGFAALSAPLTLFLLPAFLVKYVKRKNRDNLLDASILSFFFLVQVLVVISFHDSQGEYQRFTEFNPQRFLLAFLNDSFGMLAVDTDRALYLPVIPVLFFTVFLFVWKWDQYNYQLAFIAFLVVTVLSQITSLGMSGAPRYSYIPSFILFYCLTLALTDKNIILRVSSGMMVFIILLISAWWYKFHFIYTGKNFPEWEQEVHNWRENSDYQIKIHPENWHMNLKNNK